LNGNTEIMFVPGDFIKVIPYRASVDATAIFHAIDVWPEPMSDIQYYNDHKVVYERTSGIVISTITVERHGLVRQWLYVLFSSGNIGWVHAVEGLKVA